MLADDPRDLFAPADRRTVARAKLWCHENRLRQLIDAAVDAWRGVTKRRITHTNRPVELTDDGDLSRAVLVLSSGRSGSTLLMHVLNFAGDRRLMFEPFQEDVARSSLFAFRYVCPEDDRAELIDHMAAVLSGRFRDPWVDQLNQPRRYSGRVVKCIRANLAAKWVARHFPDVPIILLVRHPFAVGVSRIRQEWTLPATMGSRSL